MLFGQVWPRRELAARDRSLLTISALIAGGNDAQLGFHLRRGVDSGLTPQKIVEAITHLAFYVGWPKAISAMGAPKDVLAEDGNQSSERTAS